jgi:hypothetical protein
MKHHKRTSIFGWLVRGLFAAMLYPLFKRMVKRALRGREEAPDEKTIDVDAK